jgi:hypothetical protein
MRLKYVTKFLTGLKIENRTDFYDNPFTFVTCLSPTRNHHITKIYLMDEGKAARITYLSSRCRRMVNFRFRSI